MTPKQAEQFNAMRSALRTIAHDYLTTDQLRRSAEHQYGLEYEEVIEMAYDNIRETAEQVVKGVRRVSQRADDTEHDSAKQGEP